VIPVLTAAEMREADRRTIEEIGLPGPVLMENAGASVASLLLARFSGARRAVILCGKGNNGGDGFVIARRLLAQRPEVFLLGRRADVKGDARMHLGAYERSGGTLTETPDAAAWDAVRERILGADLIVDAMLGTGLASEPIGLVARAIADLATLGAPPRIPIVAVDLPSGLRSDSGDVAWPTVHATLTVAFAAPKHGHVLPPACDRVGELAIADIGIPATALAPDVRLFLLEPADARRAWPPRAVASHKGDYGHVLVIAGSLGKTGAAALAAAGALRAGAGLVTVATPADALPLLAPALRVEAMVEPLPLTEGGGLGKDAVDRALALAEARDVVVLGPGLGSGVDVRAFVREVLAGCTRPMIVDADGLNAVAPVGKGAGAVALLRRSAPTIVTPHPGEMARLIASSSAEVQRRRLEIARAFAIEIAATVVLKGQRTIVADAGGRAAVNPTGNPGMATGGSGDVLAGMLGALLARHSESWTAATAGVFLHGLAGDHAAAVRGMDALLAGDLVEAIPAAIGSLRERE
jgi:ADP-dependent NAD(P)H-hydrate dehydratase / NAD(P)H-hydrate epimerase